MPWITGHLQPRINRPTWAFIVLITHPVLWIYHLFPELKKTVETLAFFMQHGGRCRHRHLVGRTNFGIFLGGLQKIEQRAKKCIELRGECIEMNPEFIHCSLFPSF
jgi:hypothetical protein